MRLLEAMAQVAGQTPPAGDDGDALEVLEGLTAFAESFLWAGGSLSLEDLANLAPVELAALERAGKRLATFTAVRSGAAAHSPAGAAAILADLDGGATLNDLLTQEAVSGR